MKCKTHPYEAGVGVCASCLRERLLALVANQNEASAGEYHRRSRLSPLPQRPPQPLLFQRSVSPYVPHRRSADCDTALPRRRRCRPFLSYSTPQLGPTAAAAVDLSSEADVGEISSRKHKFSLMKSLFGTTTRSSWFSSLSLRRRRSKSPAGYRRPSDRGMSPAETVDGERSGSESGYSTDRSTGLGWRLPGPTPLRRPQSSTPSHPRHRYRPRDLSGFTLCLSPLVRPSPGCPRRSNASESGFSGDLRGGCVGGAAAPGTLAPNRSRKLADRARFR